MWSCTCSTASFQRNTTKSQHGPPSKPRGSPALKDIAYPPLAINHRFPKPLWSPQSRYVPYHIPLNAKPTEQDFFNSGIFLYTEYQTEVDHLPAHVALSDYHVFMVLQAKPSPPWLRYQLRSRALTPVGNREMPREMKRPCRHCGGNKDHASGCDRGG